jgi:hypothetical protein
MCWFVPRGMCVQQSKEPRQKRTSQLSSSSPPVNNNIHQHHQSSSFYWSSSSSINTFNQLSVNTINIIKHHHSHHHQLIIDHHHHLTKPPTNQRPKPQSVVRPVVFNSDNSGIKGDTELHTHIYSNTYEMVILSLIQRQMINKITRYLPV